MNGMIEGYVVTVGVYVEKTVYVSNEDDEESAVAAAIEELEADIDGLDYESDNIEILSVDPEYYEDE